MVCEVGVMSVPTGGNRMSYEEALEVIENTCPCHSKGCPESDPIVQGQLALALSVARAEEFYVDGQIDAYLEARAFGDYDERLEP